MDGIPQLGPEVYVDDTDDTTKQAVKSTVYPLLSETDIPDPRSSFITHGLDGAANAREGSVPFAGGPMSPGTSPGGPGRSPQLSPHRPTNSAFSFESGEQIGGGGGGSGQSSRRGSAVSADNVLEVLDNSAWGESIRRSFTMRRPSKGESS